MPGAGRSAATAAVAAGGASLADGDDRGESCALDGDTGDGCTHGARLECSACARMHRALQC
jgi:hypothetical protein